MLHLELLNLTLKSLETKGTRRILTRERQGGAGESTVSVLEADSPWITLGCGLLFLPVTPKGCAM